MICPNCNRKLRVMESRNQGNVTFRRYVCECGVRLYTKEQEDKDARNKLTRIRADKKYVDNHNG